MATKGLCELRGTSIRQCAVVLIGDVRFVNVVADIAIRITGEEISVSNKHLDQNGFVDLPSPSELVAVATNTKTSVANKTRVSEADAQRLQISRGKYECLKVLGRK